MIDNKKLTQSYAVMAIRKIIQEALKEKPLTPESIAEMFDPVEEKRYYDMFMKAYEEQQENKLERWRKYDCTVSISK